MSLPAEDRAVHDLVDEFLAVKAGIRISTVINTIFPVTLYVRCGRNGIFERVKELWPKLESHSGIRWGTYFRRMTSRTSANMAELNPLADMIRKLAHQADVSSPKYAAYELACLKST